MEQADIYQLKRAILGELEALSEERHIDLYYADEAAVALAPCVPYAWQFKDEEASMPSAHLYTTDIGRGALAWLRP